MAVATKTDLGPIEQYIEDQLQPFHVPGVSVAVIKDGEVLMARGFGARKVAGALPMTADTVMPIGSTS